jgi:DNA helicase-2/ATP-dependent DNA helicase PcrA
MSAFPIPQSPPSTQTELELDVATPPRRRGPSAEELLEGLNEPQRAAVMHAGRPGC